MQSSSDPSLPRKRRRTAKSCEQCRHRKIGCDQAHPCGPCRRSRDQLTCTYRDLATTAPASIQPGPDHLENVTSGMKTGRERAHPQQTTLATGGLATATQNGHRQTNSQCSDPIRADDMIQRLEERVQRLEAKARNAHGGVDGRASPSYLSADSTTVPLLRFTKAKVKVFSQSHWVHTAKKVCSHIQESHSRTRHRENILTHDLVHS